MNLITRSFVIVDLDVLYILEVEARAAIRVLVDDGEFDL